MHPRTRRTDTNPKGVSERACAVRPGQNLAHQPFDGSKNPSTKFTTNGYCYSTLRPARNAVNADSRFAPLITNRGEESNSPLGKSGLTRASCPRPSRTRRVAQSSTDRVEIASTSQPAQFETHGSHRYSGQLVRRAGMRLSDSSSGG
eukprot:1194781-Prorocentrum_minimum.AAC.9